MGSEKGPLEKGVHLGKHVSLVYFHSMARLTCSTRIPGFSEEHMGQDILLLIEEITKNTWDRSKNLANDFNDGHINWLARFLTSTIRYFFVIVGSNVAHIESFQFWPQHRSMYSHHRHLWYLCFYTLIECCLPTTCGRYLVGISKYDHACWCLASLHDGPRHPGKLLPLEFFVD